MSGVRDVKEGNVRGKHVDSEEDAHYHGLSERDGTRAFFGCQITEKTENCTAQGTQPYNSIGVNELLLDWCPIGVEFDVGLICAVVKFLGIDSQDDV